LVRDCDFQVLVAWQEVSRPIGGKLPAFILDAEKREDPDQCSDNKVVLNAQGEEVVILDD
jgi:hypothetical protein